GGDLDHAEQAGGEHRDRGEHDLPARDEPPPAGPPRLVELVVIVEPATAAPAAAAARARGPAGAFRAAGAARRRGRVRAPPPRRGPPPGGGRWGAPRPGGAARIGPESGTAAIAWVSSYAASGRRCPCGRGAPWDPVTGRPPPGPACRGAGPAARGGIGRSPPYGWLVVPSGGRRRRPGDADAPGRPSTWPGRPLGSGP